jgi:hypothetical protein
MMLTAATLGLVVYALYSITSGTLDIALQSRLEPLADMALVLFGLVLLLSAAFVRVMMPGGLALALGALFALQALSLHSDAHLYGSVSMLHQVVRAAVSVGLVALAYFGAQSQEKAARRLEGRDRG